MWWWNLFLLRRWMRGAWRHIYLSPCFVMIDVDSLFDLCAPMNFSLIFVIDSGACPHPFAQHHQRLVIRKGHIYLKPLLRDEWWLILIRYLICMHRPISLICVIDSRASSSLRTSIHHHDWWFFLQEGISLLRDRVTIKRCPTFIPPLRSRSNSQRVVR